MGWKDLTDWQALSSDYGRHHRTRGNRLCHRAGIPLIMLAVLAWTWPAASPAPLAALLLPVYFLWDWRIGLAVSAEVAVLSWAASRLGGVATLAAFALGVVFQYVGHRFFERRSPAFADHLIHLLVGPAWILTPHPMIPNNIAE